MKKKIIGLISLVICFQSAYSQSTNGTGANSFVATRFLGWDFSNGVNPLSIRTNNIPRMTINGNTGTTSGFVGIGTTNPLFRLSIVGSQIATGQGWTRGILMSNSAALMWDGGPYTTRNYFMAHSSGTPDGDFYQGYSDGIGSSAPVTYTSKVYVNSAFPGPSGSTQIFKWLVVQQDLSERRLGVNTTNPFRVVEIKSNLTAAPQLRMTTTNNSWTDLQTLNTGNFVMLPQSGRVGINLSANPTANLDVNGNARIRNVQTATPNSLIVGVNAGSANDVNVRRLDFPNDNTVALLGDGTWGPAQGSPGPQGPIGPVGPAGPQGPAGTSGGAVCGSNFTVGRLTANTRLNLSNNNYYFNNETSPANPTYNRVAIGYNCTPTLSAKFNVMQKEVTSISFNSTASHAQVQDVGTQQGQYFIGHRGLANGVQTVGRITNNGGYFTAANTEINYGVRGDASAGVYTGAGFSFGGYFTALNYYTAGGLFAVAVNPSTTGVSYGILASGSGGEFTRSGFFEGLIETTATYVQTSDAAFKTNVNRLSGTLKLLQALKPVSYTMDVTNYPQMNFDEHLQFGYIAQDVADVFPNLVYESYRPSRLDSLGNHADSSVTYKSLNYSGFIAVNTQAIIELNKKVDAISLSDESIKTNVQNLTGSLAKVLDMRGVSYDWDHTVNPELILDSTNQVGFVAQEIQAIDPRLTFIADDNLLHVKYEKVVPILAEAIEELNGQVESKDSIIDAQQSQINDLNMRLSQLENCLSGILPYLCQLNQSAIQANTPVAQEEVRNNLNVTLNNRNTIILDQNVPNPFAEQTVINFSIPETVKKAQIHFYDGQGKLMQSVDAVDRGLGSITVFGSDLSSGVYTYTLVADGQVVATKKMMKQ